MSANVSIFPAYERPGIRQLYLTLENAREARGWQTICQLFMLALLTIRGSVAVDPEYGTPFVEKLWGGSVRNDAQLKAAFDFATMDVMQYLQNNGYMDRRSATARLGNIVLRKWAMTEGHAELWVDFFDAAGNKIAVYWVPVNRPDALEIA